MELLDSWRQQQVALAAVELTDQAGQTVAGIFVWLQHFKVEYLLGRVLDLCQIFDSTFYARSQTIQHCNALLAVLSLDLYRFRLVSPQDKILARHFCAVVIIT